MYLSVDHGQTTVQFSDFRQYINKLRSNKRTNSSVLREALNFCTTAMYWQELELRFNEVNSEGRNESYKSIFTSFCKQQYTFYISSSHAKIITALELLASSENLEEEDIHKLRRYADDLSVGCMILYPSGPWTIIDQSALSMKFLRKARDLAFHFFFVSDGSSGFLIEDSGLEEILDKTHPQPISSNTRLKKMEYTDYALKYFRLWFQARQALRHRTLRESLIESLRSMQPLFHKDDSNFEKLCKSKVTALCRPILTEIIQKYQFDTNSQNLSLIHQIFANFEKEVMDLMDLKQRSNQLSIFSCSDLCHQMREDLVSICIKQCAENQAIMTQTFSETTCRNELLELTVELRNSLLPILLSPAEIVREFSYVMDPWNDCANDFGTAIQQAVQSTKETEEILFQCDASYNEEIQKLSSIASYLGYAVEKS